MFWFCLKAPYTNLIYPCEQYSYVILVWWVSFISLLLDILFFFLNVNGRKKKYPGYLVASICSPATDMLKIMAPGSKCCPVPSRKRQPTTHADPFPPVIIMSGSPWQFWGAGTIHQPVIENMHSRAELLSFQAGNSSLGWSWGCGHKSELPEGHTGKPHRNHLPLRVSLSVSCR